MNATRKIIVSCMGFLIFNSIQAQTSLTIYPLNRTIGIKYGVEKKISLEHRFNFQFDFANGESNMFVNTELLTTYNFLKEENFTMYSGIGLGVNAYTQAQSNFSGTLPLGATYYFPHNTRIAIISECGIKITALDFAKLKSYALVGIQIHLRTADYKEKNT